MLFIGGGGSAFASPSMIAIQYGIMHREKIYNYRTKMASTRKTSGVRFVFGGGFGQRLLPAFNSFHLRFL
jgi:hypothetical protein